MLHHSNSILDIQFCHINGNEKYTELLAILIYSTAKYIGMYHPLVTFAITGPASPLCVPIDRFTYREAAGFMYSPAYNLYQILVVRAIPENIVPYISCSY